VAAPVLVRAGTVGSVTDPHKWVIHGERLVDDTPHVRISQADVELPNHVQFTQYVFRMRHCAMTVVLDDAGERVLLMRRHRFIVDRWVWELPGGYVDDGEEPATAAAREVEEETGWRPRGVEFVMSCQPLIGNADYPQDLYLAHGAKLVGEPEVDEAAEVGWIPLDEAAAMIAGGEILGAITIIGVQHALLAETARGIKPLMAAESREGPRACETTICLTSAERTLTASTWLRGLSYPTPSPSRPCWRLSSSPSRSALNALC
jgi:8-oxo-dGTP pyrophosphatase MutT (NUDIX family)